jgi:uncharacterized protein
MLNEKVDTKESIINEILSNKKIITNYGVKKLGLFGSFVQNEQQPESDIDFLIEFEENKKTFDNYMELNFFLEDIFKRPVEMVTTEGISRYIGPHILNEVTYVDILS